MSEQLNCTPPPKNAVKPFTEPHSLLDKMDQWIVVTEKGGGAGMLQGLVPRKEIAQLM